MADVVEVLSKYYPNATVAEGLAIRGRDAVKSKEKVVRWLEKTGF